MRHLILDIDPTPCGFRGNVRWLRHFFSTILHQDQDPSLCQACPAGNGRFEICSKQDSHSCTIMFIWAKISGEFNTKQTKRQKAFNWYSSTRKSTFSSFSSNQNVKFVNKHLISYIGLSPTSPRP